MWWLLLLPVLTFFVLLILGMGKTAGNYDKEVEELFSKEQAQKTQNELLSADNRG